MNSEQAVLLWNEMFEGDAVSADAEQERPLGALLRFIGAKRIGWDHDRQDKQSHPRKKAVVDAADFLVKWAESLRQAAGSE